MGACPPGSVCLLERWMKWNGFPSLTACSTRGLRVGGCLT